MLKIGFIDYYLDEWHALNYPQFFKDVSDGKCEVCYVWGKIDAPNGMTNREYAEKYNLELTETIEEVIEKSDCLVVLSPDNPEMHEELCELALRSEKPVYVDKTFAPDKDTALRIFKNADTHNTKCWSSSALGFAEELALIDTDDIVRLQTAGGGSAEIYSIHQIEPIVKLMKTEAKRLIALGDEEHPSVVIEFKDGRFATMYLCNNCGFEISVVNRENMLTKYEIVSDFFRRLTEAMVRFFETGEVPVSHERTVEVMAIREAMLKAIKKPGTWIEV